MDKVKLEILGISSSQAQSDSFALVLGEKDGDRRLPIVIGTFEAQSIAIELENIRPNRPMTHDLFKPLLFSMGCEVKEVIISAIREGVFFAKMVVTNGSETWEIDTRPSDAVAIGIRFEAEIYADEHVLEEAAISFSTVGGKEYTRFPQREKEQKNVSVNSLKDYSIQELKTMLQEAIKREDYEKAVLIRDEISRRQ